MLRLIESHENLNIQSSSLKKLMIEKNLYSDDDAAKDKVMTIWAPNVEILEISGSLYSKYSLMNVSSLTDATLLFSNVNGSSSGYELHGEMLKQVFQSIHHVERVTLSNWCIKVLGGMKKKNLLSPTSDAKFLKLYEAEEIVDLLKMFPKLTMNRCTMGIQLSLSSMKRTP